MSNMKKVQCEVCGSNDIRKTADDLFVCQHCGTQYRTEDMRNLLVEIKEILENIDNEISQKQEPKQHKDESNAPWDRCCIAKARITPQDNVRHFLNYLEKAENIVCDIYKEISIEQTKEFYLPFYLIKGQYNIQWSAIACHTYYENEVVYEKRMNASTGKWVNEPVNRQVERVQRTHRNGSQNCKCRSFIPASMVLENVFGEISADEKTQLFAAFREQQESKFDYGDKLEIFDQAQLQKKDDHLYYGTWEILNDMEPQIANEERSNLQKRAKRIAYNRAQTGLNGGKFENYSESQEVVSESLDFVYVPVQVITYLYKGQKYVAVSDLVTITTTIPAIYPCDQNLVETKEQLEQETDQANRLSGLTVLGLVSIVVELFALLFMGMADFQEEAGLIALLVTMVASLVVVTVGLINDANRRKKNRLNQNTAFDEIYAVRKLALRNSKEAYCAAYPNAATITTDIPAVGSCSRALCCYVLTDYYEESAQQDEKLLQIQQLQREIAALEKKRTFPIILMAVFGVLFIPLVVGSILLGNINAQLNQKRPLLQSLRDEYVEN